MNNKISWIRLGVVMVIDVITIFMFGFVIYALAGPERDYKLALIVYLAIFSVVTLFRLERYKENNHEK